MTTIGEAWEWYQATRQLVRVAKRLGEKYWDDLPWGGGMGTDHVLGDLDQRELAAKAEASRNPLEDVAIGLPA